MSGNTPSNDEEAPSSQTPQEESGAIVLQNEADPQTQGQRPQGPSADDLRYMLYDLDLLQADEIFRLRGYIHILRVRDATRPSTPVPSEISVDQLSTQQILDLRRIVEHDIKEVRCLAAIQVADPGFWELINGVHQRYFLLINQNKLSLQLSAIALIPASPLGQLLSLLTPIVNFLLHAP
ncbi:hypothetical protein D6C91_03613 [Aureobasidium pullulans]|uniref:Uncharacterized protein n=1 Tax=Aureobasidium pullulans TaxID=5580 RepID=A0A4S9THW1_AURPU|nr:hypothetical protein D6C91_03613 [Aureobasidium pullulans]